MPLLSTRPPSRLPAAAVGRYSRSELRPLVGLMSTLSTAPSTGPVQASHEEVLGKVSAILQNYDVGPSGKKICIEDLDCCPYDCGMLDGDTDLTEAAPGYPTPQGNGKNAAAKKALVNPLYERDQFFPLWRSVLTSRFISKIFPPYAPKKELPLYTYDDVESEKLRAERHSQVVLGTLERNYRRAPSKPTFTSNYRSRRLFGTAASTVLKMLKRV